MAVHQARFFMGKRIAIHKIVTRYDMRRDHQGMVKIEAVVNNCDPDAQSCDDIVGRVNSDIVIPRLVVVRGRTDPFEEGWCVLVRETLADLVHFRQLEPVVGPDTLNTEVSGHVVHNAVKAQILGKLHKIRAQCTYTVFNRNIEFPGYLVDRRLPLHANDDLTRYLLTRGLTDTETDHSGHHD